jgi:hypothetical protein
MGLFDKFRRKSPPNLDTPEQLLDALTDAIARQDGARSRPSPCGKSPARAATPPTSSR